MLAGNLELKNGNFDREQSLVDNRHFGLMFMGGRVTDEVHFQHWQPFRKVCKQDQRAPHKRSMMKISSFDRYLFKRDVHQEIWKTKEQTLDWNVSHVHWQQGNDVWMTSQGLTKALQGLQVVRKTHHSTWHKFHTKSDNFPSFYVVVSVCTRGHLFAYHRISGQEGQFGPSIVLL